MFRRGARVRQAHCQMSKRHGDWAARSAVFEPIGDVLGQVKRLGTRRAPIEPDVDLRLGDVQVELLAKAAALGPCGKGARRYAQLSLRAFGSPLCRG
jgi:hypothetical protein